MNKTVFTIPLYCFRFTVFSLLFVYASSCSISKQINKQATRILLQDSVISTGHIGISIYEPATSTYWYNYNADKFFVPASNVKLFTLYTGMKYLGDSLVAARYYVKQNQLYLIPSGDPTFLNAQFKSQILFDLLKRSNISWIGLEITKENWKANKYGKGWAWDDFTEKFSPQRSAFPIYGNLVKFRFFQDSVIQYLDSIRTKIKSEPSFFNSYIERDLLNSPLSFDKFTIENKVDENRFLIKRSEEMFKSKEVPFSADFATIGGLLSDTLQKATYSKRAFVMGSSLLQRDSSLLYIVHSQPTDSLLKPMMYNSDNFFAEQTLLMTSNEHLGFMDDEKMIDTLLSKDFKDIPQQPRWVDGSGLSRYNLFTPQSFVYVLNKMKNEFGLERMKRILPTGGQGTIQNYYGKDSGFIFAKTGSMGNQAALSGYLITKQNKLLIFSILNNNFQGKSYFVKRAVEKFLEGIREKY